MHHNDLKQRLAQWRKDTAAILGAERTGSENAYLETAIYICGKAQRNSAAAKGREPLNRKERAEWNEAVKPEEEAALRSWAEHSGIWIDEDDFNRRHAHHYVSEGGEQKVYWKDDRTVIKVNLGFFHGTWLDFFVRMQLHKVLFPATSYTLTGCTQEEDFFGVIIEQPIVDVVRGATRQEVASFLYPQGFVTKRNDDYYSAELGILLEDLHDENVFINEDGLLFFVDPVIYLETVDMGLGGGDVWRFPWG